MSKIMKKKVACNAKASNKHREAFSKSTNISNKQKQGSDDYEEPLQNIVNMAIKNNRNYENMEIGSNIKNEPRQNIINTIGHQIDVRKEITQSFQRNMSKVITELENSSVAIEEATDRLRHFATMNHNYMEHLTTTYERAYDSLKCLSEDCSKQTEGLVRAQKKEARRFADELENDMKNIQEKTVADAKRKGLETLRNSIFLAMEE